MSYTYEQLNKMTVVELRKIADGIEHEATKGHSTMHKEKLLPALCIALGIEAHAHHEAKGVEKGARQDICHRTTRHGAAPALRV